MPYPYGMYGPPAVGNGLGGLPRRNAVTVPTASTRYDLQTVATGATSFPTYSTSNVSTVIMLGGKIYAYYYTTFTGTIYRYTADYSNTGLTNESNVDTGLTSITQLPSTVSSYMTLNYCWSIEYSPTFGLFCYTNTYPFLVTITAGEASYTTYPTINSGTYANGGTYTNLYPFTYGAIIGKNGDVLQLGRDNNDNPVLIRFDPTTLAFKSATLLAAGPGVSPTFYQATIVPTSYGYVIGVSSNSSSGNVGYLQGITLANDLVTVIDARKTNISDSTSGFTIYPSKISCGAEGIFATFVGGSTSVGFACMYTSATGVLSFNSSVVFDTTTSNGSNGAGVNKFIVPAIQGTSFTSNRAGSNINGTQQNAFFSTNASYGGSGYVFAQQVGTSYFSYYHMTSTPAIDKTATFSGYVNTTVHCVRSFTLSSNNPSVTAGVCADNNGFVTWVSPFGSGGVTLFKKVYR